MDKTAEIIQDLSSDNSSFRVFALERAIREGDSPELLKSLLAAQEEEKHEECLLLFSHAIVSVKNRLGERDIRAESAVPSPDQFPAEFTTAVPTKKVGLLSRLTGSDLAKFASQAPLWIRTETNPVVISTIIRKFQGVWPRENLSDLTTLLFSEFLLVRFAALETLSKISPDLLIRDLPRLLSSGDPKMRALAIQGLARLDPDEAILHMEEMLESSDHHHRLCAIQNCFYLPFDKVKAVLLKFLAFETKLSLLEKAGYHFQINADPEIPFRIWEIAEKSGASKATVLKRMIKGACQAIENSGLLGGEYPEYLKGYDAWLKKRSLRKMLHDLLSSLLSSESPESLLDELASLNNFDREEARVMLQEALDWDLPEPQKKQLEGFLESMKAPPDLKPGNPRILEPGDLEAPDAARKIAALRFEKKEAALPILAVVLRNSSASPEIRANALRTSLVLDVGDFADLAETFLKHPNEKLLVAALEYLSHFDPDRVFPLLGIYLQSPRTKVKSTALNILKNFDSGRAVSLLSTMLSSKEVPQKSAALACMLNFDFSLVRALLVSFLKANYHSELLDIGLCLFGANPDPENLFLLYSLEKSRSPEDAKKIEKIRRKNEAELVHLGILKPEQIKEFQIQYQVRFQAETEKQKQEPPAYSVSALRGKPPEVPKKTGDPKSEGAETRIVRVLESPPVLILGVVLFLTGIFLNLDLLWSGSSAGPKPRTDQALPAPGDYSGFVVDAGTGKYGIFFKSSDGRRFFIFSQQEELPKLKNGDKIKVSLIPVGFNPQGVVVALCQSLVQN